MKMLGPMGLGVFLLASTTGCAGLYSAPVIPPVAFVYSKVSAPIDIDVNETRMGQKKGTAETINILGLISTGDASVQSAAKNGGIKVIRHADYEFTTVLGLYSRFTTVVYGD
jgi:hypothetical protein